jgi:hypothetical protein
MLILIINNNNVGIELPQISAEKWNFRPKCKDDTQPCEVVVKELIFQILTRRFCMSMRWLRLTSLSGTLYG